MGPHTLNFMTSWVPFCGVLDLLRVARDTCGLALLEASQNYALFQGESCKLLEVLGQGPRSKPYKCKPALMGPQSLQSMRVFLEL